MSTNTTTASPNAQGPTATPRRESPISSQQTHIANTAAQQSAKHQNSNNTTASPLTPADPLTKRYARQLLLPALNGLTGQRRLQAARVLIIGLGGLGCPAALYLAGAGIGTLGLVDADTVETSNLHRQIAHDEASVGLTKVESVRRRVRALNSEVVVEGLEIRVGGRELVRLFEAGEGGGKGWDLILDCSDNPATRYAVSDVAVLMGVPLVSGAAQRGEGMAMVLHAPWRHAGPGPAAENGGVERRAEEGRGPCYRCVFPRPPAPDMVKGCSEIGVLGTAVGLVGVLMAQEAIKLLVLPGMVREGDGKGEMLLLNAFAASGFKGMWRGVGLRGRRQGCVSCGVDADVWAKEGRGKITREEVLEGRMDYEAFCGRIEDVKVLGEGERVGAEEFLARRATGRGVVVDVREEVEVELGTKLNGAINVPYSRILRNPEGAFRDVQLSDVDKDGTGNEEVYFVCHRGNDSQIVARHLMDIDEKTGKRRRWIGDVAGGFVAMERLLDAGS
jgi:adenylyltransferase and sulfurtransferase